MAYTQKIVAVICLTMVLVACNGNGTPAPTPSPTSTVTSTPLPPPTKTTNPIALRFIEIPAQVVVRGESLSLDVYGFLRYRNYAAGKMNWTVAGSEHLAANIAVGVVTVALLDPSWQGSETIQVEGCEPSGACAGQEIAITAADPSAVRITYTCNDGFMIAAGGKKVLIDVLFQEADVAGCQSNEQEMAAMASAGAPFGGADLVLVTHDHSDHFEPQLTGSYLKNSPRAQLVTLPVVAEILSRDFAAYSQIEGQIRTVLPAEGQPVRISVDGIDLEAYTLPNDVPSLGFLVRIGGLVFFHSGDSGDAQTIPVFQSYQLPAKGIDLAFVPFWYLSDPGYRPILDSIQAQSYVPMHIEPRFVDPDGFAQILEAYPAAILFRGEMQTMIYPGSPVP
jgi:L-ascorbate metabolism protein UlaG (beta-lactamase superfamily)